MKRHQYCKASALLRSRQLDRSEREAVTTHTRWPSRHSACTAQYKLELLLAKVNSLRSSPRQDCFDDVSVAGNCITAAAAADDVRCMVGLYLNGAVSDSAGDAEIAITATYTDSHVTAPLIF